MAGRLRDNFLAITAVYALVFVVVGVVISPPGHLASGLFAILAVRDTLITDYMGVGGVGAAFVNAGLLTLLACFIYCQAGAKISGSAVACLFLVLGFALFGKSLVNIWPTVAGVWLYCRFKREPFRDHINVAFFGAALAPVFSEILFSTNLSTAAALPLALATSVLLGFILSPVAANLFKAHQGYTLYNMGFTAGIAGTLIVSLYRSYGFVPEPVMIWTTGNNLLLSIFLGAIFLSMIALGLWHDARAFSGLRALVKATGQSPSDFIETFGAGPTLLNMGLTGLIGTAYVVAVGGDLNGPTVGAILSIVGFAAFGKHCLNILPIMLGVFIGALAKPWSAGDPSVTLAALFGTTLAPIAGQFGWRWGIVAGFIHSSAALSVGPLHGGLNLYNNGFAAGLVAAVLVPVILAVRSRKVTEPDPPA